jgi:hypothetical protein
MKTYNILCGLSAVSLAACGGGADPILGNIVPPGPPAFDAYLVEAEALAQRSDGLPGTMVFPAEDNVTMTGLMFLAEDFDTSPDGYIGDFEATVNFATGNMSGSATDFYYAVEASETTFVGPAEARAGTITLQSAPILPGLNAFNLAGTLQVSTSGSAVSVLGSGTGGFVGVNGDVFALDGSVNTAGFAEVFEVGILAER